MNITALKVISKILNIFKIIIITIAVIIFFVFLISGDLKTLFEDGILFMLIFCIIILFIASNKINKIVNSKTNDDILENKLKEKNYIKMIDNFYVNEVDNKLKINNNIYDFKEIKNVELIEDGNISTITTGKKKASLGKSLVGGALLGGVGAIAGAGSGKINSKSIETKYCTNLTIKIDTSKLTMPCEFIKLITYKTDKESLKYKNAFEDAQKCISTIKLLLEKNN